MAWHGTTEDGLIVVTDGNRRLEALTTEPHHANLAALIARTLNALDDAEGDPAGVDISAVVACDDCGATPYDNSRHLGCDYCLAP